MSIFKRTQRKYVKKAYRVMNWGVVAPLWLRAKSAYGGGRGMFRA